MIYGVLCQRKNISWILGVNPNTDPYFSDVVSLWHCDNTSPTVGGGSISGPSIIPAALDGANAGVVSYSLPNSYYSINPSGVNPAFLTTDWTLEFFASVESHPTIQTLLCKGADNGSSDGYTERSIDILADGRIRYATYSGGNQGSIQSIISTNAIEYGKRQHIAIVQQNTLTSIYVNGVLFASGAIWRPTGPYWGMRLGSHCFPPTRQQSGAAFDEFRLTKNIARYTGAFTPPNIQFPNS